MEIPQNRNTKNAENDVIRLLFVVEHKRGKV